MSAADQTTAQPAPRRWRRFHWLWWVMAVLAGVVPAALIGPRVVSWLRPAAPVGVLVASGRIEGRVTTLTPRASAWVAVLHVDEGQAVQPGQLLATLDDQAQRERVRSAEAQLNALTEKVRAADTQLAITDRQVSLQIDLAGAALREAEARLQRARGSFEQAERDAQRAAVLVGKGLIAAQESEHAGLAARVAEHAVREAEAAVLGGEKQLALARLGGQQLETMRAEREALARQGTQAAAQLAEQKSHVADFSIRSPIAGRVLTRTVERGERVDAGTPLFTLVDLDSLYVKIYVPEPSVGRVALGQEARVYVDTYPGQAFPARVSRISEEAEFTPKNVETREERVKLVFAVEVAVAENPGGLLKPGMPADAVIRWQPDAPWITPDATSRPSFWRRDRDAAGK
jgi:HlyD family secretion protein